MVCAMVKTSFRPCSRAEMSYTIVLDKNMNHSLGGCVTYGDVHYISSGWLSELSSGWLSELLALVSTRCVARWEYSEVILNISSVLRMTGIYILKTLVHGLHLKEAAWRTKGNYLESSQNSLSLGSASFLFQISPAGVQRWSLSVLGVHLLEWPRVSTLYCHARRSHSFL